MPHFGDVGDIYRCVGGRYGGVCVVCGDQCIE